MHHHFGGARWSSLGLAMCLLLLEAAPPSLSPAYSLGQRSACAGSSFEQEALALRDRFDINVISSQVRTSLRHFFHITERKAKQPKDVGMWMLPTPFYLFITTLGYAADWLDERMKIVSAAASTACFVIELWTGLSLQGLMVSIWWTQIHLHALFPIRPGALQVRPARLVEMKQVYDLTYKNYRKAEYVVKNWDPETQHFKKFGSLPQTTVFVAIENDRVIGSVSMTIDSEKGLPYDEDFREQIDEVRYINGRPQRVAAVWRLVIDDEYQKNIKILLLLIQAVIRKFRKEKVEVGLFGVHPKRKPVYTKLFRMRELGYSPGTTGLANAPSVLLSAEVSRYKSDLLATRRQRTPARLQPRGVYAVASSA